MRELKTIECGGFLFVFVVTDFFFIFCFLRIVEKSMTATNAKAMSVVQIKKCIEKHEKLNRSSAKGEKYINLGKIKNTNLCPVSVDEPILLNPNSYENLVQILDSLKENLAIGREREWTVVGCDGPPYCLASRVIDNDKNKYDWVTMQPGLGHLNMNQLKGFFKVIAMCSLFS